MACLAKDLRDCLNGHPGRGCYVKLNAAATAESRNSRN
jgi:hypothetical protein